MRRLLAAAFVLVAIPITAAAAEIAGTLVIPAGATPPAVVHVRVPDGAVACPVVRNRWRCIVPSGEIDLRIEADGFVPRYLWNVVVSADTATDLGKIELQRGASVSGLVKIHGAAPPAATVTLVREPAGPGDAAPQPLVVKTNARGFFQAVGVAQGSYTIVARQEGWTPVTLPGFRVSASREHALRDPLLLEPLASIQVSIEPALDPQGKPWIVSLDRPNPRTSTFESIVHGTASVAGYWSRGKLEAGTYSLRIVDSRQSAVERRDIKVDASSPMLHITLGVVVIRGSVTAGDERLQASLNFANAGTHVHIETDDEGRFTGVLPREGEWTVQVRLSALKMAVQNVPLVIRRRDGEAEARADIKLPGARIEGMVTDESGDPVDADVRVRRDGTLDVYTITDGKGAFRLLGVRPGSVTLEVEGLDGNASAVPYDVPDGGSTSVRLVLEGKTQLKGRLVTRAGLAVPGAMVRAFTAGLARYEETASGPDGRFAIAARKSARTVDVVIVAAGLPVKITAVPVTSERVDVVIDSAMSILKFRYIGAPTSWPTVRRDGGALVALLALLYRSDPTGPPRGFGPDGLSVELEPGNYTICPEQRLTTDCETRLLAPGAEVVIDGRAWARESSGR